jgi:hypothetical protein
MTAHHPLLAAAGRTIVIAAIIATMLYWPAGIVLAALCALFGIPAQAFITFGGLLATVPGMLAWWLVAFAFALAYAATLLVLHGDIDGFGRSP